MSLRCANCNNDVNNVGEVRGCGTCQRNGTAGSVHSKFKNHDSVEALVADANPGAFPFAPSPEQAAQAQGEAAAKATRGRRTKKT